MCGESVGNSRTPRICGTHKHATVLARHSRSHNNNKNRLILLSLSLSPRRTERGPIRIFFFFFVYTRGSPLSLVDRVVDRAQRHTRASPGGCERSEIPRDYESEREATAVASSQITCARSLSLFLFIFLCPLFTLSFFMPYICINV